MERKGLPVTAGPFRSLRSETKEQALLAQTAPLSWEKNPKKAPGVCRALVFSSSPERTDQATASPTFCWYSSIWSKFMYR